MEHLIQIPNDLYQSPIELKEWMRSSSTIALGHSFMGRDIEYLKMGEGPLRILIWSQMHGNETTGLRAMRQLWDKWKERTPKEYGLHNYTIYWIPQLNPDGAELWRRCNAQGIDLNRDVRSGKSEEMRLFKKLFEQIRPHYALNLHDQRSLFSAGESENGAALSWAVPQVDQKLAWNQTLSAQRLKMQRAAIIASKALQSEWPDSFARFDDSYYPKATGEWAQEQGAATLLIESGVGDIDFGRTRSVIQTSSFIESLLVQLSSAGNSTSDAKLNSLEIPQNNKGLVDILFSRAKIVECSGQSWEADIAIRLEEVLKDQTIFFQPIIEAMGDLSDRRARLRIDKAQVIRREGNPLHPNSTCPFWDELKKYLPWETM